MGNKLEQVEEKYLDLLKDASQITEDRYQEVIEVTESEDPGVKVAAYYLLSSIMNLNLLEEDRETFVEGFDAIMRIGPGDDREIKYTGIVTLARLMKPEFLKEENLYMQGIAHLVRESYDPDPIIRKKAEEVIELRKSQLGEII